MPFAYVKLQDGVPFVESNISLQRAYNSLLPMAIASGTLLGPYEIVAPIGAGGMGEVYKARDTRLGRAVAVKILPAEFAQNAQLKARFEREAKTISHLNHPHICTLFDVGENFIVMELLEGQSLADRLTRGPLPLSDVLKYGAQIAGALGKAHRGGVIHRDLKPSNIMLTKGGAKLLDFGLAKYVAVAGTPEEPTPQKPLTQEGVIVGTFQYMAPEQLAGEEPDARTDIFTLGAVLYEMTTGKRAFEGKTKTSLIGAIVSGEPKPMRDLQPLTPLALEHVVGKCLTKEPDQRWQNATDIAEELRWIGEAGSQSGLSPRLSMRRTTSERIAWSVAALVVVAFALIAPLYWRAAARRSGLLQLSISLPTKTEWDIDDGSLALSPDGSMLAVALKSVAGERQLWTRHLAAMTMTPLPDTAGASLPFWSPDSNFIGFFADGKLKKIPAGGGPVEVICDASSGRGGTWNGDGTILLAPNWFSPISKVSSVGGSPVAVTKIDRQRELTHRWPSFLPDGRHFIYTSRVRRSDGSEQAVIMAASLDAPAAKRIIEDASNGAYALPGWLLFSRRNALLAIRFDVKSLQTSGEPIALPTEKVHADEPRNLSYFTVSDGGTLVYLPEPAETREQLRWLDWQGRDLGGEEEPLTVPPLSRGASLSPDGTQIAITRNNDIWLHTVGTPTWSRFTFDRNPLGRNPAWSADGRRLFYIAGETPDRQKLYVRSIAGSAKEEVIYDAPVLFDFDVSPDGRSILIGQNFPETNLDLMLVDVASHRAVPWIRTAASDAAPAFSTDGKWVAYLSGHDYRRGILVVRRFPDTGEQWQVTTEAVSGPRWSRDGKTLFYLAFDGTAVAVPVKLGETFEAGPPRRLFHCEAFRPSPDGKRFLAALPTEAHDTILHVVLDWQRMLDGK